MESMDVTFDDQHLSWNWMIVKKKIPWPLKTLMKNLIVRKNLPIVKEILKTKLSQEKEREATA